MATDKKKLAITVLGIGAAITGAIALWWFYLRTPSVACTEGALRCNGNVSQICTGGVWADGGGKDCSAGSQGQLRVETVPPGDVDIYVDSVFVDSWGVDWVLFPVGNHVLSFMNPRGSPCVYPGAYTFEIRSNTTTVLKVDCNAGAVLTPEYFPM